MVTTPDQLEGDVDASDETPDKPWNRKMSLLVLSTTGPHYFDDVHTKGEEREVCNGWYDYYSVNIFQLNKCPGAVEVT